MFDPDDKEIDLMDKILLMTVEKNWQQEAISERLNISEDEYQFLIDKIIDFNESNFKIVNPMDKGESFQSIEKCFETQRFLNNGGFKKHFTKTTTSEIIDSVNSNSQAKDSKGINIIGDNIQGNTIIIGDKNINHSNVSVNDSKATNQQNKTIEILQKYWWAFIVPILVVLTSLAIEYKWFVKN